MGRRSSSPVTLPLYPKAQQMPWGRHHGAAPSPSMPPEPQSPSQCRRPCGDKSPAGTQPAPAVAPRLQADRCLPPAPASSPARVFKRKLKLCPAGRPAGRGLGQPGITAPAHISVLWEHAQCIYLAEGAWLSPSACTQLQPCQHRAAHRVSLRRWARREGDSIVLGL